MIYRVLRRLLPLALGAVVVFCWYRVGQLACGMRVPSTEAEYPFWIFSGFLALCLAPLAAMDMPDKAKP